MTPGRLAPTVVAVIGLMAAGLAAHAQDAASGAKVFDLTAQRFSYAPNRIEVQQGDHVIVHLHSTDVEHGFSIKELGVSTIIPEGGAVVSVDFVASKAGTFEFACSSYCGKGHPDMTGVLVVQPAAGGTPVPAVVAHHTDLDEPDFTVITLPTTLGLPKHKMAFRVTHRFTRPLNEGSFSDLAADLFGLDSSAQIGLELRFAPTKLLQVGIYRTNDRTISLFAQHEILKEGDRFPISLALNGSVEGSDNFGLSSPPPGTDVQWSPHVSIVVSRHLGGHGAVYVQPSWVGNTNLHPDQPGVDDSNLLLNLGLRIGPGNGLYFDAVIAPRLAGFVPHRADGSTSAPAMSFALEHRVGGHLFQFNVSNTIGTTPAQFARAQDNSIGNNWYLGFMISRKFF
jgi:cytochrome c oxidase subunit 2